MHYERCPIVTGIKSCELRETRYLLIISDHSTSGFRFEIASKWMKQQILSRTHAGIDHRVDAEDAHLPYSLMTICDVLESGMLTCFQNGIFSGHG